MQEVDNQLIKINTPMGGKTRFSFGIMYIAISKQSRYTKPKNRLERRNEARNSK